MFLLSIDVNALIYTCLFCIFFAVSYFVVLATRLETLFKQGSTWQIKLAQIIIAFVFAYLLTQGAMALFAATQF